MPREGKPLRDHTAPITKVPSPSISIAHKAKATIAFICCFEWRKSMSSRCAGRSPLARAPTGKRSSGKRRGGCEGGFSLARTEDGAHWLELQEGWIEPSFEQTIIGGSPGERGGARDEGAGLRWAWSSLWLGLQQSAAGRLGAYFWAGIMSSMAWPFSSFFSISTMSFTPSTTSCTCSTSDEPSRSALDTSNTEPTAAVSTPPVEAGGRGVKREQRYRSGARDVIPV